MTFRSKHCTCLRLGLANFELNPGRPMRRSRLRLLPCHRPSESSALLRLAILQGCGTGGAGAGSGSESSTGRGAEGVENIRGWTVRVYPSQSESIRVSAPFALRRAATRASRLARQARIGPALRARHARVGPGRRSRSSSDDDAAPGVPGVPGGAGGKAARNRSTVCRQRTGPAGPAPSRWSRMARGGHVARTRSRTFRVTVTTRPALKPIPLHFAYPPPAHPRSKQHAPPPPHTHKTPYPRSAPHTPFAAKNMSSV
jgi:hypothetical protein